MQKNNTKEVTEPKAEKILLGIDAHIGKYVVVRQIDGSTPQPAQRFNSLEGLLKWAEKQLKLGHEVWSCYEAGPLGYVLHRKLAALGVKNIVVRPKCWDEYGRKVKTDKRDALALVAALDRYVSGNRKALAVVRVRGEEEEQRRSISRQREFLKREVQRIAAHGRGTALFYGVRLRGPWWRPRAWARLENELADHLLELLGVLRELLVVIEEQLDERTRELEKRATGPIPKGLGALTDTTIEREVGDWHAYGNRRAIGGYSGLCSCEDSSGGRRSQGSINKHGNARLRPILIEAAWRMLRFQPGYIRLKKWRAQLRGGKMSPGRKKKMIVAIARCLIVDLWRLKTGRTTMEELGLIATK